MREPVSKSITALIAQEGNCGMKDAVCCREGRLLQFRSLYTMLKIWIFFKLVL